MNSKSSDDAGTLDVEPELAVEESKEGASNESRTDRIRRLNRERQRRRRMKLKMSRHGDPTMAPDASNVNMNLDNLEAFENADLDESNRTDISVKTEPEIPESALVKTRPTRTRSSRRKQQSKNVENIVELSPEPASCSGNTAITGACHGELTTSSSNELSDTSDQIAVLVVASEIEVFGEDPNVLNGTGQIDQSLETPESGESKSRSRKREDGEGRSPRKKRQSTTSDDELSVRREKQRELKRKQKERMTPDQVEALRARYREWRRRRKEIMTSEQLEIIRRGNRERQRRRRERLGVRKRLASAPSRGASVAVIQGIRNMHSQGRISSETSTSGESSKGSVSDVINVSGLTTIDDRIAANMPVAPGIGMPVTSVPPNLPTMAMVGNQPATRVPNAAATVQVVTTPVVTTTANAAPQAVSSIPIIGPQGAILPGMPPGAFFPGMPMAGMFPGIQIPVTGGQGGIVPGTQASMVTTIPLPGIPTAQGAFLSGIPVTSTQASAQGFPQSGTLSQNPPPIPREGQVLHNFQTLLPITPVQGVQGTGQGMTFFTQLPQGFQDPKYTVANQGNAQVAGLPPGTQIVQVPLTTEVPTEFLKSVPQESRVSETPTKPKSRGRGRKRNTSAAEMLASLSNYAPPTSTPMASMLSALASSARDRLNTSTQQVMAGTEDVNSDIAQNKSQTVVQSEGNAPVLGLVQVQQNQPPGYTMYMSQQRAFDPYAIRTVVSTAVAHATDMNAINSYSLAGMNSSPSSIPHMNTFLTTMGGANKPGTPFNTTGVVKPQGVVLVEIENADAENKISVAVATDTIQKATKATNTGDLQGSEHVMSIGTMTDSLYRSSVATNTDTQKQAGAGSSTDITVIDDDDKASELIEAAAAAIKGDE